MTEMRTASATRARRTHLGGWTVVRIGLIGLLLSSLATKSTPAHARKPGHSRKAKKTTPSVRVEPAANRTANGGAEVAVPAPIAPPLTEAERRPVTGVTPRVDPPPPCPTVEDPALDRTALLSHPFDRHLLEAAATAALRCPSPTTTRNLAVAHELVGRQEISITHLDAAVALFHEYALLTPPPADRDEAEGIATELQELIRVRRARVLLDDARTHAVHREWARAMTSYDRYLAATPGAPDHAAVLEERRRLTEHERDLDPAAQDRQRKRVGASLVAIGVVLLAASAVLVPLGVTTASGATSSNTVGDHDQQLSLATNETIAGAVSGGVGLVLLVAGAARLAAGKPEAKQSLSLWLTPTHNGVMAGGIF